MTTDADSSAGPGTTSRSANRQADVVVIGSGLAGLTAAAALAASGRQVVVLEQYSVVGGSTHVFRRKGKWEWQVGVHHLADCGPDGDMPTIFRGLGIGRDQLTFRKMDEGAYERLQFPDVVLDTPNDWELWEQRLGAAFPAERRRIARLLKVVRRISADLDRDRDRATADLRGFTRAAVTMGPYAALAMLPLSTVLNMFGLSKQLQLAISISPSGSLNVPPSRLPFVMFAGYYRTFVEGGSWFPEGGGQMLSSSLLRVVEQFGGEVVTGESVDEIIVQGGATTGVRTASGRVMNARVVISTADLKKTFGNLLPADAVRAATRRRVQNYRMSYPVFNAFLGLDIDLRQLVPNLDHFSVPTWTSIDEVHRASVFREDDTVDSWLERMQPIIPAYVHCSNLKDPGNRRYSPAGSSSVETMMPLQWSSGMWGGDSPVRRDHSYRESERYAQLKEGLTETLVQRTVDVLPEAAGHIVHQELATPLTQERFTQSTNGACYGIELSVRQFGVRRPGPVTEIDGLYLAGASCRPGPATEGVMLSGIQAAGAVLGRDLLAEFRDGRPLVESTVFPVVSAVEWDALAHARGRRGIVSSHRDAVDAGAAQ